MALRLIATRRDNVSRKVPSRENIDRLIGELYDAATVPGLWSDWLSTASGYFGSDTGLAVTQSAGDGSLDLLTTHNFGVSAIRLYTEYYHKRDLWAQRMSVTPMKALTSAEICSDEEFANSELYNDLSKPHAGGQFYVVGAVLPAADQFGIVGFQNTRRSGPFSRRHAQALDLLLPHLQRALTVRARLKEAEGNLAASYATLDSLSHGILLVSRDCRVVHANQAAEAIVSAVDGLSLGSKGSLATAKSDETSELHRLIVGCSIPAGGGALSLTRPSGRRALEAMVVPLGVHGLGVGSRRAIAAVFLRDPEAKARPPAEILRNLYRLTPAEARLAVDLLAHRALEEIAETRRLSRETLRTQLKELFRKTGTRRQSELIGFLVAGLASGLFGQRRTI